MSKVIEFKDKPLRPMKPIGIPTVMRSAFESARVTRETNSQALKRCLSALKRGSGVIRRRQLWNKQVSNR